MNRPKKPSNNGTQWISLVACTGATAILLYLSTGLGDIWALAWTALLPLLWLAYGCQPLWRIAAASFVAFGLGNVGFVIPFLGSVNATIGISLAVLTLAVAGAAAISFRAVRSPALQLAADATCISRALDQH